MFNDCFVFDTAACETRETEDFYNGWHLQVEYNYETGLTEVTGETGAIHEILAAIPGAEFCGGFWTLRGNRVAGIRTADACWEGRRAMFQARIAAAIANPQLTAAQIEAGCGFCATYTLGGRRDMTKAACK